MWFHIALDFESFYFFFLNIGTIGYFSKNIKLLSPYEKNKEHVRGYVSLHGSLWQWA